MMSGSIDGELAPTDHSGLVSPLLLSSPYLNLPTSYTDRLLPHLLPRVSARRQSSDPLRQPSSAPSSMRAGAPIVLASSPTSSGFHGELAPTVDLVLNHTRTHALHVIAN